MKKHLIVVGLFDDAAAAVDTIKELRQGGFSDDQIGFVVRYQNGSKDATATREVEALARDFVNGLLGTRNALLLPVTESGTVSPELEAANSISHADSRKGVESERSEAIGHRLDIPEKRGASIITGSVIGGTLGAVAAILLPEIGSLLVGGLLAATFASAPTGGVAGCFLHIGVPEYRNRYYEEQFRVGRIILIVKTDEYQLQVLDIMQRYRALGAETH